ncbi:hypothetical protein EWM64_g6422 [Hericium alpestre]|uniref:CBS domain-containing protein n=1 Tax=Hericium alpestre TaxID=135208 RepID=A0A4Y9ZUR8_9AGAM|nr:hypothetical protein EWM64_g6422 [Hericium alpestre]
MRTYRVPSNWRMIATSLTYRTPRNFGPNAYLNWKIRILDHNRKPLGYLDVPSLKKKWEAGEANPSDAVSAHMSRFNRSVTTNPYTVITADTPLADLERFLQDNIFALVTDYDRKFVLAVATGQDLEVRF